MPELAEPRIAGPHVIVQDLRRRGLDPEVLANEVGLELRELNRDGAWFPYVKHAELLELAATETGDDCYGLYLSECVKPQDFGAIGYIGLASQTIGDALLNMERYLQVICEAYRIVLSVNDSHLRVTFEPADPSFSHWRQAAEFGAGAFIHTYRQFSKRPINLVRFDFVHSFDGEPREHERVFGCPVRFDCDHSQLLLDRADMAAPIDTADDRLLTILISYCDYVLETRAHDKPEQLAKVERCIMELMPTGRAKASIVASELGMSERTLVRRLAEFGTSFSEVLAELRHQLALKYLHQKELNLTQIAFLLGYANPSAFSTAFKRMTGQAPREVRGAAH